MSGLFIGENETKAIAAAISAARAKPMPLSVAQQLFIDDREHPTNTLMLHEREQIDRLAEIKREYPSHLVQLGTHIVAISFEEQPAGLMRHLSIASRQAGMAPNEHVIRMVCEAFGFSAFPPLRPYRIWIEEFGPGHMAINLVEQEP
jgi:hypothetical protein